ncbi:MAG: hypothetical protein K9G67_10065 [Bacteroidales bacterium]|nr:hypothetical protein [Bacteroidales bacterium]MCF8344923.1 hypothetical protein [Bacteroidales bacterium]MCF8349710.1 hypothetical protein [Bacteroidales bacterium]MCF8376689.1 hypothetical protein [Bacteroidales bacterium]MCF8401772.1 hypothetical protein [Bacteroidales bacterium]
MKTLSYIFLMAVLISACGPVEKHWDVDVSDVEIEKVKVHRYGKALFNINTDNLKPELGAIADEFAFFLKTDLQDSLNLIRIRDYINDPKIRELNNVVQEKYADLGWLEQELQKIFKYYKYHYRGFEAPRVYSYISGMDVDSPPVIYIDSVMIIALDLFLGEAFDSYKKIGLPQYLTRRMQADFIKVEAARSLALNKLPLSPSRTMLDEIILHGKLMYFIDACLPNTADSLKIGYTEDQIEWCRNNESQLWAFMIDKELLYSADYQNIKRFTMEAPFTSGFGHQSPGRIGIWIGWQIVREYMENKAEFKLDDLMHQTDAQTILRESGYKPRKD